jgi:hypothetical protein
LLTFFLLSAVQAVVALRAAFPDSEFVQGLSDTTLLRYIRARSTLEESITILQTTIVRQPAPDIYLHAPPHTRHSTRTCTTAQHNIFS